MHQVERTLTQNYSSEDFESVDFEAFAPFDRYKFMTASVVPRPIALVTTLGVNGQVNAAPFSQFIILSLTPSGYCPTTIPTMGGVEERMMNWLKGAALT